uniref:Uncharacterized protein n=1 Tax=Populus alba TaxID=43335 RepID=A0A4U5P5J1_POPAL|nr:hypothetical protein D5086_0000227170 [Populus alba]
MAAIAVHIRAHKSCLNSPCAFIFMEVAVAHFLLTFGSTDKNQEIGPGKGPRARYQNTAATPLQNKNAESEDSRGYAKVSQWFSSLVTLLFRFSPPLLTILLLFLPVLEEAA